MYKLWNAGVSFRKLGKIYGIDHRVANRVVKRLVEQLNKKVINRDGL